ncbi:hypothetical protein HAX54_012462 [Datura stramonium]|uniref:Uncharacterized protein n=1 Tax=Datura stramonium TaxID=4076 RepID=A0ABS8TLE8_DATST|nr:hypothetical protein [Datura stramonium]
MEKRGRGQHRKDQASMTSHNRVYIGSAKERSMISNGKMQNGGNKTRVDDVEIEIAKANTSMEEETNSIGVEEPPSKDARQK